MKKVLFTLGLLATLFACNTASTDHSEEQQSASNPEAQVDILGKWTSILDLSQCDSSDMMIQQLQQIADVTTSNYIFKENGKGESMVYMNDTLENETSFDWTQNGDTIFTSNEYSTNVFLLNGDKRMDNDEFKDNPQKVRHYLER